MKLHRQAVCPGRLEHLRDLRRREADALAEGIDRIGQAGGRDGRQHVAADGGDIGILVARGLRRQRMGAEEGRGHRERPDLAQPPRRLQRLHLGRALEPVARLHFQRRHALGHQRIDARQGGSDQLVLAGGACRLHGRDDAAAGARQLLVGGARQAQLELVRAVAAVDDVGVAVDQAGRDPAAVAVDHVGRGEGGGLRFRAGIDDGAVARGDQPLLDDAEAIARHRREARALPDAITLHVGSDPLVPSCSGPYYDYT